MAKSKATGTPTLTAVVEQGRVVAHYENAPAGSAVAFSSTSSPQGGNLEVKGSGSVQLGPRGVAYTAKLVDKAGKDLTVEVTAQ